MERRHVRAVYRWVDGEDTTITFDLALDDDRVFGNAIQFGFVGALTGSFFPFVLTVDGRIDFGCDYADEAERFIPTDLRDRPVRLGEVMTTRERGEDGRFTPWTYRCIRVDAV